MEKEKSKFLFNEFALAKVFRARFLEALTKADLNVPNSVPENGWSTARAPEKDCPL